MFGDWDESYHQLPRWLVAMKQFYPKTIVQLQIGDCYQGQFLDPNHVKFERLFWVFKPCINALPFYKTILHIDGTFLYGKNKQSLLIATTQDRNRKALPIAFIIVKAKNRSNWTWFLKML